MISSMREYARSLKIVLLIVVIAFIATSVYIGAASLSGDDPGAAGAIAVVNGEKVPVERYRRVYSGYLDFYRQLYRERLTPEAAERLGLSRQVLNELVQDALIVQAAEREGMRIGDEELRLKIQSIKAFQDNGAFSRDRYLALLRQSRMEPGVFEAEQRREMARRKMEGLVRDGVKVSDDEVVQAYLQRREKVRAEWALLALGPLAVGIAVSDADAAAYLKVHEGRFVRPERRRVVLALLGGKSAVEPVSDADVATYYKERGSEFERPARRRAAHVLVRVPPTGGSDAETKARAKVEDVIRRAKGGADFAALAKEASDDTASAAQGGDLGYVGKGEMVPEFERAVFSLGKGEVTPAPIRTEFGFHAVKVIDVQEGGRAPLAEVTGRIKDKLLAERTERAAQKRADEVKPALLAAKDFGAEARKLGLEVREATIARGEPLEGFGRDQALEELIFTVAAGGTGAPTRTAAGYVFVRVAEVQPAGVPPLDQVKLQVVEAKRRDDAEKIAVTRATALADAAGKAGDLGGLARKEGFTTGTTDAFSLAEPLKGPGALPGNVMLTALQTASGQVSRPVTTPAGVYVLRTVERSSPDPKGADQEREEIRRQLLEQKRGLAFERWVASLRSVAKIEMSSSVEAGGPAPR